MSPAELPPAQLATRSRLLKAAERVFARLGYDAATVKDVAQAAGVNVGLISYYFGGKEGLYLEVLRQFAVEKLVRVESILKTARSLDEFRTRTLLWIEEFLQTHVDQAEVISLVQREVDAGLPRAGAVFQETFWRLYEHWERYIQEGQKLGFVPRHLDAATLAQLVYGSLIHTSRYDVIHCERTRASIAEPAHRRRIAEHVVEMVAPRKAKVKRRRAT